MNNLIKTLCLKRSSKFDLAIVAFIFAAFVLGCGGGSSNAPKKPIPAAYLGDWTGQDGTRMSIRQDNTGDYKQGSTNVSGAAVEVDEETKVIKFTMLGIDVGKYTIDSPPKGNQMKVNGVTFRRSGGFDTSSTDAETTKGDDSNASSGEVPSESELNLLVGQTMEDFNSAIQSGDFETFHGTISEKWQEQITAEKLAATFDPFVKQKRDLSPKAGVTPTYSPSPTIDKNGLLAVNGTYPNSDGKTTQFNLTYIKEGSDWKLFGIRVNQK